MKLLYFSGFCLENESALFSQYLIKNDFTVSGFSYGAQKALEYVLKTNTRVDTLQLFSPAYFNDKDTKYKRMQLIYFNKDSKAYSDNFLDNCEIDKINKNKYFKVGTSKELEELLNYTWSGENLKEVVSKGINIEIYLGANDKIIDSYKALDFFRKFGEIYYIQDKGHML